MTEAGWTREWADKLADAQTCPQCAEQYGMGDNGDIVHAPSVARLLRKEHARAVRIVKRAKALQFHGLRDTDTNEFLEGYEAACVDILAALSKGRA